MLFFSWSSIFILFIFFQQGRCHYKSRNKGATDTGFIDIPTGDEDKLKEAVGTVGPVSVAIDASQESFQFYHTGKNLIFFPASKKK